MRTATVSDRSESSHSGEQSPLPLAMMSQCRESPDLEMKLRQLEYVHEVVRSGMNVSSAASALHTSQPGVSHQIRALEEELKLDLFVRDKGRLVSLTPTGQLIVGYIDAILANVESIQQIAQSATRPSVDSLTIVATHTQARYVLPDVLRSFAAAQPDVRLSVRHSSTEAVLSALLKDADVAITPVAIAVPSDVVTVECRRYARIVVLPPDHPLDGCDDATLADIARYPLIMYEQSVPTRSQFLAMFEGAGLQANVALNVINSDVMKACVESGLGIAIVPEFVYSPERDTRLRALRLGHLFPPAFTLIGLNRRRPLNPVLLSFVRHLAPALTLDTLAALMRD